MLKIQISKIQNQRDQAQLDYEKLLMELKEAKLALAIEKEKGCEKFLCFENHFKKIIQIFKVLNEKNCLQEEMKNDVKVWVQTIAKLF